MTEHSTAARCRPRLRSITIPRISCRRHSVRHRILNDTSVAVAAAAADAVAAASPSGLGRAPLGSCRDLRTRRSRGTPRAIGGGAAMLGDGAPPAPFLGEGEGEEEAKTESVAAHLNSLDGPPPPLRAPPIVAASPAASAASTKKIPRSNGVNT